MILKKKYNKKNELRVFNSNNVKVIFRLLIEVIIFYMKFTLI